MNRLFALVVLIFAFTSFGCGKTASEGTVEVIIEGVGPRDIDTEASRLEAIAGLQPGTCAIGPCSPNPCLGDLMGRTQCIGQGDANQCVCPAGSSTNAETGMCEADIGCVGTTCNNRGQCMDDGAGVLTCECAVGFSGSNCQNCDTTAGFYPDGLGSCADDVDVCRENQGADAFNEIIAKATEELGHPPNELELNTAKISIIEGAAGVRSWPFLFREDVTLFFQTVQGFPNEAGIVSVPEQDAGTPGLEFEVLIDRPTLGSEPEYFEGLFGVGVRGQTDRNITDTFSADIRIEMEFSAF